MKSDWFVNQLMWARMQALRWTHWRPFVDDARHPRETQRRVLLDIVRRNRNTQFGREHGFEKITCYKDFAAAVPVQDYESLRPYLEKQERTGEPALNAEPPVMYAQTSGTTGKPKLIPILAKSLTQHKRSQSIQSFVQFSAVPQAYYGRILGIVSPAVEGTLESGTPYGSASGHVYKNLPSLAKKKYVLPEEVFGIGDYELKYLVILRLALPCRNLSCIATANPSTLLKLLSVAGDHREALRQDVSRGTFHQAGRLSPQVRAAITPLLGCAPDRVRELDRVLASPKPTFAELWPNLRLVTTWTGGSCRIALAALRKTLPPGVCVAELGYLSSEFRGTITVDLERNLGAPTIHENFFEFVERDDWDAGRKKFRTVEEIEQGQEYYIIITTAAGLYRYFMNDIITVTGMFRATPAIEFVQKGKGVTNITGEKLSENQVVSAVRSTEDELGLASGFFLMLADIEGAVYRLVVEWSGTDESNAERLLESVERKLGELNLEYAQKRASGRLRRLELVPVSPGAGEAYKQHCLEQGQREGQFKLMALQYQHECAFPFDDFRINWTAGTAR